MAKIIMTCGKICAGKSTYALNLRDKQGGIILSVDEITLALFGQNVGEYHDLYVERAENYLFDKSLEVVRAGVNAILDWGFWTKRERDHAREFYRAKNIENEIHYIEISEAEWQKRVDKRNRDIANGTISAYFVDEGLALKVNSIFEPPSDDEIDVKIKCY